MSGDRERLIREDFELYRDFEWYTELAPKCKEEGMDAVRMLEMREAWNAHTEVKDWPWWQERLAKYSIDQLQDMVMDSVERLDVLGMKEWQQERSEYKKLLAAAARIPANDYERGIDR